jgi:hypothetical protein
LFFGQDGNGGTFFTGVITDCFIINQNVYDVDPSDSNSTVPVRTAPAKGALIKE